MKKLCVLLAAAIVLGICWSASADREEQYVRDEAARRNITLLSVEQAGEIAVKRVGTGGVRVKDVDLEDEADDYPNAENFRPVYKVECISGLAEYDVEIDAVTGEVLKFKRDD